MKMLRVTMPDGTRWDVPAAHIAANRAQYYATKEFPDTKSDAWREAFALEQNHAMTTHCEIVEWAENNMNWEDVAPIATNVGDPEPDYQEGWVNGPKAIVEVTKTYEQKH